MAGFWKRLMGRRNQAAIQRAEAKKLETASERRFAAEGVDGLAADKLIEERLGGRDPMRLVDDQFKA
jgi:hypothetical protein